MSVRTRSAPLSCLGLALLAGGAGAQESSAAERAVLAAFGDDARARLADDTLLERVGETTRRGRPARLLEGLDLSVLGFEGRTDSALSLGLSYSFVRAFNEPDEIGEGRVELVAHGQVAFESRENPDPLQTLLLRKRWSGSHAFGSSGATRAERAASLPDPERAALVDLDASALAGLERRLPSEPSPEEVRASPGFQPLARSYARELERSLPPEWLWDYELHAGLESDQRYSSRQVVLGASLGGRLLSWDPASDLSRYDVFDLPSAALRWLSGADEELTLSGLAWPSLVAGLDLVDASRDGTRSAQTDDRSFLRARLEASVASPALVVDDEPLHLRTTWRVYQEVDAPAEVKAGETDGSRWLEFELELPRGWSLSYAMGRLPLDAHDDSTFSLGFRAGI